MLFWSLEMFFSEWLQIEQSWRIVEARANDSAQCNKVFKGQVTEVPLFLKISKFPYNSVWDRSNETPRQKFS